MISGDIYINDDVIGEWRAANIGTRVDQPGIHLYACRVKYRDNLGYPHEHIFEVRHVRNNGALRLVSIILDEAARRIPNG